MPPLLSFLLIANALLVAGVVIAFLVRRRRAAVRAARTAAATTVPALTHEDIAWRIGAGSDLPSGLPAPAGSRAQGATAPEAQDRAAVPWSNHLVAGVATRTVEDPATDDRSSEVAAMAAFELSTRRRLWRDAAGVLLVTVLVILVVTSFASGSTSGPAPSADDLSAPVMVAVTPGPTRSSTPAPEPASPAIASPAPTLPETPASAPPVALVAGGPDARADAFTVNATRSGTLKVLDNDVPAPDAGSDPAGPANALALTAVTQGAKGSVSIAAGGAAVRYAVTGCASGDDSFTYDITDDAGRTDTATVSITIARPGQNGLPGSPITDRPTISLISGSTIAATVPARLSWCGVTRRGTGVRSYVVQASGNGGATYPMTVLSRSTARSIRRDLPVGPTFRWRARTTDTAGRTGSWRVSQTARISRYEEVHRAIRYAGSWKTQAAGNASGGQARSTRTAGASARLTLTGVRQFAIVGPLSANRGSFEVWVDGAKVATVSQAAGTTADRRVLYVGSLTGGAGVSHRIEVRAVGDGRIDLDAVLALS